METQEDYNKHHIYKKLQYENITNKQRKKLGRDMDDLETIIQSEVNQKEKNRYYILMCICGIQTNSTDEPNYKTEMETQTWRTNGH